MKDCSITPNLESVSMLAEQLTLSKHKIIVEHSIQFAFSYKECYFVYLPSGAKVNVPKITELFLYNN